MPDTKHEKTQHGAKGGGLATGAPMPDAVETPAPGPAPTVLNPPPAPPAKKPAG